MFLTDPGMVPICDKPDLIWLDGPLVWQDPNRGIIRIPAGFISDDASTPRFLDWIPFLDRQGLSRRPGLLHDGVYALGRVKGKDWCDELLRDACIAEGMTAREAWCYYQGVHLFGQSSYDADAKEGVYGAIESGDFYTEKDFNNWVADGATVFRTA